MARPLVFVVVVEQKAEAAGDPSTLIGRSVETAAADLVENREFSWRRRAYEPKRHRQQRGIERGAATVGWLT